jgi:hypothetical protein
MFPWDEELVYVQEEVEEMEMGWVEEGYKLICF